MKQRPILCWIRWDELSINGRIIATVEGLFFFGLLIYRRDVESSRSVQV